MNGVYFLAVETDLGLAVNYVGTGFMCIQRKVFEDIINKYPQIEYKTDVRASINNKRETKDVTSHS